MMDTANFDGIALGTDEKQPIVSDAEPEFFSSLESFHVTRARFRKTMQCGENLHRGGLAEAADIGLRASGPNDPLHFGA